MDNLELMYKRLKWQGGIQQENRMIKDKFRTLQKVLKYSYQACTIAVVQPYNKVFYKDDIDPEMSFAQPERALINPDKTKQDYDDKIISIPYESGIQPGDVFEWKKTDTFWIVYLEALTEDAYFRGEIRRCRYKINFKDKNNNWCSTWAAIRGPVETQINSIQKNQQRIDEPNWSLNILMPKNEATVQAFDRYSEFLLEGRCWRVETVDSISMKNIIEINAEEYYIDRDTDDVEHEMKNGLVIEKIDPNVDSQIQGPTFIKPKISEAFYIDTPGGKWTIVEKDAPVDFCITGIQSVRVTWRKTISGQFTLRWSKDDIVIDRTVVVESLY